MQPKLQFLNLSDRAPLTRIRLSFRPVYFHLLCIIFLTILALSLGQDILKTVGPGHGINDSINKVII
jgi:hypothetical protein